MKIVVSTYAEGPFVLLVQPRDMGDDSMKDAFIVGEEREAHSSTITCFATKERALEVAKQYESVESVKDDVGIITVMSIRDAGFLKRFMSW